MNTSPDDYRVLVDRYLDETATDAEIAELNRLLETRPEAAAYFVESAQVHALLRERLRDQAHLPEARAVQTGGGSVKFWFCEKCGKRQTEQDIAEGSARDKKLKGVYCSECATGVLTLETLPVTDAQARKIVERERKKAEEGQAPEMRPEGSERGQGTPARGADALARGTPAHPAAGSMTPAPLEDSGPLQEIHYGTGIHKFSRDKDAKTGARRKSSGSLRALRKHGFLRLPVWPIVSAACALVGVTLYFTVYRGGGITHVAPTDLAEDARVREALEKNRQAKEELARKEEAERQARAQAARTEAERQKAQERFAELERKKQELAAAQRLAESQKQADAAADEARRQELARLEAQRKVEEAKLAQAAAQARLAAEEQARAEAERLAAEQRLAESRKQAKKIGRVIFVVELKKEAGPGPVLVRGKGADATRLPLSKDMPLRAGDRIETGARAPAGPASGAARPVHAALELASGATVDLADATHFDLLDAATTKLDGGLLYAEVSGVTGKAARQVFKTEFADVVTEAASFDLTADPKEAVLQVGEGTATFKNAAGERALNKLQKSVARKDFAPGPAAAVQADGIWRGVAAAGTIASSKPSYNGPKNAAAWKEMGRIVGRPNKDLPAYTVQVLDEAGRVVKSNASEKGGYELWLKPGTFTLRVSAKGYTDLSLKSIEVKAQFDLLIDFEFTTAK